MENIVFLERIYFLKCNSSTPLDSTKKSHLIQVAFFIYKVAKIRISNSGFEQ